jgi:hypothetical protein
MDNVYAIFISGPPASGKTTCAHALARLLGTALFDLDTLSEPFLRPYLAMRSSYKDSDEYHGKMRDLEYEALFRLMKENLSLGVSCIAVAPFSKERKSSMFPDHIFSNVTNEHVSIITVGISIVISPSQQYENMLKRGAPRDTFKIEKWQTYYSKVGKDLDICSWNVDLNLAISFEKLKNYFDDEINKVKTAIYSLQENNQKLRGV